MNHLEKLEEVFSGLLRAGVTRPPYLFLNNFGEWGISPDPEDERYCFMTGDSPTKVIDDAFAKLEGERT